MPPPPSNVIFFPRLPTYRKMFERNCDSVFCPAPTWLSKDGSALVVNKPLPFFYKGCKWHQISLTCCGVEGSYGDAE